MGFDLIEIAKAWITAANPNSRQTELATKRYNICLGCSWYRKSRPITHDEYCGSCTCPLSKKIFSNKFDACPEHFWEDIENEYKDILSEKSFTKNKKTII